MKKLKKENSVKTNNQSPLELIKNGIISKNWDTVAKGYTSLTGDPLTETCGEPPKTSKRRGRPPKAKQSVSSPRDVSKDNGELEINNLSPVNKDATVPIGQLRKPCFPFANVHDPAAKKLNQKLAKAAAISKAGMKRQPYKPIYVSCSGCNTAFELNKEYPLGRVDDPDLSKKYYCNKCRGGNR